MESPILLLLQNKLKGKQIKFCKELFVPPWSDITLSAAHTTLCPLVRHEANEQQRGMQHLSEVALSVIFKMREAAT